MIVQLEHICKAYGPQTLFTDVTFKLEAGDRMALVGPNGAGKTTLLDIIAGIEDPDEGRVVFTVGYLEQEAIEMPDRPIFDEVLSSQSDVLSAQHHLAALEGSLGADPTQQQLDAVGRAGIDLADVAACHAGTAACGAYALAAKRAAPRCLALLHHHSLQSFGLNRGVLSEFWPHNLVQFPMLRRMHEAIDCHVFVSEQARKSFYAAPDASWSCHGHYRRQMRGLGFYRPVRRGRSIVLHNGVDTSLFTPGGRRAGGGRPFTIGTVANFEALKGHAVLLEALSLISGELGDWRLMLVGSGPEEGRIRETIARRGLGARVKIVREMAHDALPGFYRSLDLFVLPSVFEAFGCVYTEAYACGTPFIACAGQGIAELVPESERGLWLATSGDAVDLAGKIEAYHARRPRQHLAGEIAIDPLVREFLGRVFDA